MSDQALICQDCGAEFVFAEGEQAWFAQKGYQPPKRCQECRKKKKEAKRAGSQKS